MTKIEWTLLKDYSLRFAETHYAKRQNPCLEKIRGDIETLFEELDPSSVSTWMDLSDYISVLYDYVWCRSLIYASDRQRKLLKAYGGRGIWDEYDNLKEDISKQYLTPLCCAVRSGIDLMSGDIGVLGFTAGDIQAMYPDGIPEIFNLGWIDKRTGRKLRLSEIEPSAPILL